MLNREKLIRSFQILLNFFENPLFLIENKTIFERVISPSFSILFKQEESKRQIPQILKFFESEHFYLLRELVFEKGRREITSSSQV
jgi:hypothetical protein